MAENRKLGRMPRAFDQTIPHMSSLAMGSDLYIPPSEVHWTISDDFEWGMMNNHRLGCCTCSTAYHMMQGWSAYGREEILTQPDEYVEKAYREFAGYDGTSKTDNGAIIQDVLKQWLNKGVPIKQGTEKNPGPGRSFIKFYCEVDPRDIEDVKRAINDCGCVYIGFNTPAWLMEADVLPDVWDVQESNNNLIGGHAVSLHGYDSSQELFDVVSWGKLYKMSFNFFYKFVDEVYALAHPWFIDSTGKTPLNKKVSELEELMHYQLRSRSRR